jgi:pre-mRNA-splicing factor CWC26
MSSVLERQYRWSLDCLGPTNGENRATEIAQCINLACNPTQTTSSDAYCTVLLKSMRLNLMAVYQSPLCKLSVPLCRHFDVTSKNLAIGYHAQLLDIHSDQGQSGWTQHIPVHLHAKMPSLADYLAKNYLTADPPAKKSSGKKRKRKDLAEQTSGLIIADDDETGFNKSGATGDDDDRDDGATFTGGVSRSSEFRKKKESGWKSLGSASNKSKAAGIDDDEAEANAILASAVSEDAARRRAEDDEAPMIVAENTEDEDDAILALPKVAGLQSAADAREHAEKKRRAERRKLAKELKNESEQQETIYRDASGRIINVAMKRAEARREQELKERKEKEERDAKLGDVQLQMRDERKQALDDAKYLTVARSKDDVEMNEDLKARERWNDPAAGFLTKPARKKVSGRSVRLGPSRPEYQGAFEPNRYGIKPGYRWDGVDRTNGFERKWFAARNKKEDIRRLEYQWEMDE